MQALVVPADIIKKLTTLFFRLIWKKKCSNTKAFEKVKRRIMCQKMEEGGLSIINVDDLQNSFLLSWAKRLIVEKNMKNGSKFQLK